MAPRARSPLSRRGRGGGGQRAAAEDTRQGCGFPQSDAREQSVGACGRRLEAGGHIRSVVSQFVELLAQACAGANGDIPAPANSCFNAPPSYEDQFPGRRLSWQSL
jgi:hypothetical protein